MEVRLAGEALPEEESLRLNIGMAVKRGGDEGLLTSANAVRASLN
jgi:hypothetical protein